MIVVPITSVFKGIPSHVRIDPPEGGLSVTSYAVSEQIQCISKDRLVSKKGSLQSQKILKDVCSWIADFIRFDS